MEKWQIHPDYGSIEGDSAQISPPSSAYLIAHASSPVWVLPTYSLLAKTSTRRYCHLSVSWVSDPLKPLNTIE